MKHIYSILLLFISVAAMAQRPGATSTDTSVYRINENDVKRFIAAHKSMNLTRSDFEWMKDHNYEANQNSEVYTRIRKSILAAGFKDYAEYAKVSQRIVMVWSYQDQQIDNEQIKQMEEGLNNPGIPEQYKTQMRQQLEAMKKQNPTPAETQSVAPHRKELDDIFAKFTEEG